MPTTVSTGSIFSKFTSIFKSKDPLKREIIQSASILDRMLRSLEFSKKNLETAVEEHQKKLKLQGDDNEMAKILDDEIKNIHGYISIINKTIYDLARVKYRLETLFYVEEPLKVLPEIIEELRAVEPVIEKINPQLINHIKSLEQKVASIMTLSSSYIPGYNPSLNSRVLSKASDTTLPQEPIKTTQQPLFIEKKIESVKTSSQELEHAQTTHSTSTLTSKTKTTSSSEVNLTPGRQSYSQPIRTESFSAKAEEPVKEQVSTPLSINVDPTTRTLVSNVPLHVVEQWILNELKISGGILDLRLFETRYGVSRSVILEALNSLESKNLIKIRRK